MQRFGSPPSYPNLKIRGLNAPIPEVLITSTLFSVLGSSVSFCCRVVHLATILADGENHLSMNKVGHFMVMYLEPTLNIALYVDTRVFAIWVVHVSFW